MEFKYFVDPHPIYPHAHGICAHTHTHTHTHTTVTSSASSCAANPCHTSMCNDLATGGHRCFCSEGWWGVGCNHSTTDPCSDPDACNGRGKCVWDDSLTTFHKARCECDRGWQSALHCRVPYNPRLCHNNICGNFGTCSYVMAVEGNSTDPDDYRPVDYICICDESESIR